MGSQQDKTWFSGMQNKIQVRIFDKNHEILQNSTTYRFKELADVWSSESLSVLCEQSFFLTCVGSH